MAPIPFPVATDPRVQRTNHHGPVPRRSRVRVVSAVAIAMALVLALASAAAASTEYLCYRAGPARAAEVGGEGAGRDALPALGRVLRDGFDVPATVDLVRPVRLCNPATSGLGSLGDPSVVLETYRARRSRLARRDAAPRGRILDTATDLGPLRLAVAAVGEVSLPSSLAIGGAAAPALGASGAIPFTCYAAKAVRAPDLPRFTPVRRIATDRFGPRVLDVRRPTRLCRPASIDGEPADAPGRPGTLVCYAARLAATEPRQEAFGRTLVATANRVAGEPLALTRVAEICLASLDAGRPVPFPTPGVLESIRVGPPSRAVLPGEGAHFTATGFFSDGSSKNYTRRVRWRSSDPAIATVGTTTDVWGYATGLAPGRVTISVFDQQTGIGSQASGGSAVFNVLGDLEAIRLEPETARVRAGQAVALHAVGIYTGGATQTITQRLLYETSDARVAVAPNADGSRSRIEGLVPGTVTVTATDPTTGIRSSDSGGDAAVVVLGHPVRITLSPAAGTRRIGESIGYTATGHFADGSTLNVSQTLVYHSSDPSIAVASNAESARSRVDAVRAGTVSIRATDPASGLTTTATGDDATLTVTGGLVAITLGPTTATRRPGQSLRYVATGHYADGATRNLTQHVLYASSKPTVAAAPNTPGDRSRVDALRAGSTKISAIDPATGLSSPPTMLTVAP